MHPMPRLDEWYENGRVQTPDVLEWLKGQTPEEWHLATCFTSLDGDQRVLAWVIDQPECELGTALNIFWKGAPEYCLTDVLLGQGELPIASSNFVILKRIADHLMNGFYQRRNVSFPPAEGGSSWDTCLQSFELYKEAVETVTKAGKRMPWLLPETAFQPVQGRPAQSDYSFEGGEIHLKYETWCARNP